MEQNENVRDLQLIGQIKDGDKEALGELYKIYSKTLVCLARTRLGSKEEAEDIVNDLFLSLQSKGKDINITTNVKAYLSQAVRFQCFKKYTLTEREESFLVEYQTQLPDHEPAPDRLESVEKQQMIHQAIYSLPGQMKKAIERRYLDEKEKEDVATEMAVDKSTLTKYLLEARKRLALRPQLKRLYP